MAENPYDVTETRERARSGSNTLVILLLVGGLATGSLLLTYLMLSPASAGNVDVLEAAPIPETATPPSR